MSGVCAASSGVRPPSAAWGSSAMPSGTSSTRLGMRRSRRPEPWRGSLAPPSTISGSPASPSYLGRYRSVS